MRRSGAGDTKVADQLRVDLFEDIVGADTRNAGCFGNGARSRGTVNDNVEPAQRRHRFRHQGIDGGIITRVDCQAVHFTTRFRR